MNQSEIQILKEELAATSEAMGRELSPGAVRLMASDLAELDLAPALAALRSCRRELSRFPTVADILARCQARDGRPGCEEAWAMLPKSEEMSGAITGEMQAAYAVCHEHLKMGDHIAARMAFKEVYDRLVREARDKNQKVKWTASLGTDPGQREKVLREVDAKNGVSRTALPAPKTEPRAEDIPVDPNASVKIKALLSRITRPLPEEEK